MPSSPVKKTVPLAVRSPERPIIEPRQDNEHWWERNGVFNPGVTEYNNQVVLLYRAYDDFRVSRLGLAHSKDGIEFAQYDNPAIDTDPNDPDERLGIEDPRITKLGDTYYIVHTVASYHRIGQPPDVNGVMNYIPWRVRTAMHTTKDFRSYTHHGVILPEIPAKNASILPEKINGKFGMYYREFQKGKNLSYVGYTNDFKTWSDIQPVALPTSETWHKFKVGFGSQPIATSEGFLMVYHAVDAEQIYRLGLVMFNRTDPSKILWYSDAILEPQTSYEREGYVPNIVYSCGALIRNEELWIYYGAADTVIGRAVLPLSFIS